MYGLGFQAQGIELLGSGLGFKLQQDQVSVQDFSARACRTEVRCAAWDSRLGSPLPLQKSILPKVSKGLDSLIT